MKYGFITNEKAAKYGITRFGRTTYKNFMVVSEFDIIRNDKLQGDLDTRCKSLECNLIEEKEIIKILNNGN